MALDPIIFQMKMPDAPGPSRLPQWRWLQSLLSSSKTTKIITGISAIVITITLITITLFTMLANNKTFQQQHSLDALPKPPAQTSGTIKSSAALPGGGISTGVGGTSGTNSPVVTITASPASVVIGSSSQLHWSVTNNPSSCTASDDWTGNKSPSGSESTLSLTKSQTYLFTLTCKTATGTGFATVSVGTITVANNGTGSVVLRPTLSFAANPTSIYAGDSSTLIWSATNNPTSCTASRDWSGIKSGNGPQSTGVLTTAKQYIFTLQCSNSAGTSPSITVSVKVNALPPGQLLVNISANPIGPITPGSSSTLTWSTVNTPTSCSASDDWSGAKPGSGSISTGPLNSVKTYTYTLTCTNGSGSAFNSASVQILPNPPTVSLNVSPSSILVGQSANLNWNVSNTTPGTTCKATGDWFGNITPVNAGSRNTGVLNTSKNYSYSLSCTNEGGTGFQNNITLAVNNPSPPVVSISVNPISIKSGQSATISWSATNNPSSCTPGNDFNASVSPLSGGSISTGALNTVKTYVFSLKCSNAGGTSNVAQTSISVTSGAPPVNKPVVTISVSPTNISTGSSATVSWSATNSPTSCSAGGTTNNWVNSPGASGSTSTGPINSPGTRVYSITCSNSAGSGSATTNPGLNVSSLPNVTVSLANSSITAGNSTTYSWQSNNASSCSGSGQLSGSMATSGGPITTGVMNTPGSYNYTVTCSNSVGGSASANVVLTVNSAQVVYCNGQTPCYGVTDLNNHAITANCWDYNLKRVINETALNSGFHRNSHGNLLPANFTALCGNVNVLPFIDGTSSIPGIGRHNHGSAIKTNTGTVVPYLVGYYDSNKP